MGSSGHDAYAHTDRFAPHVMRLGTSGRSLWQLFAHGKRLVRRAPSCNEPRAIITHRQCDGSSRRCRALRANRSRSLALIRSAKSIMTRARSLGSMPRHGPVSNARDAASMLARHPARRLWARGYDLAEPDRCSPAARRRWRRPILTDQHLEMLHEFLRGSGLLDRLLGCVRSKRRARTLQRCLGHRRYTCFEP